MAADARRTSVVADTAVAITVADQNAPCSVLIYNPGAVELSVSTSSAVVTATGMPVPAGASATLDIEPGDVIYAITPAASATVTVSTWRARTYVRAS